MNLNPAPTRQVPAGPRLAAQRGVSMIELLVSLLIFTFGMLGLAGLQTRSLAFNQSSLVRSQAAALTDDILDRMRLDRVNASTGKWDTALATAASAMATTGGSAYSYQNDVKSWKQQVEALMPAASGKASIVTDVSGGATNGTVTITIQWDDSRAGASDADAAQNFVTKTRL